MIFQDFNQGPRAYEYKYIVTLGGFLESEVYRILVPTEMLSNESIL